MTSQYAFGGAEGKETGRTINEDVSDEDVKKVGAGFRKKANRCVSVHPYDYHFFKSLGFSFYLFIVNRQENRELQPLNVDLHNSQLHPLQPPLRNPFSPTQIPNTKKLPVLVPTLILNSRIYQKTTRKEGKRYEWVIEKKMASRRR